MSLENPKIWLCLITSQNERNNIDELTKDIWHHFDGICAVVHPDGESTQVSALLVDRMKEGFVTKQPFLHHHSHAMNSWLLDKRIEQGDICVIRDSLERLNPQFAQNLSFIYQELLKQGIWNIWAGGKLLSFRRNYNQSFFGGIHWGLAPLSGKSIDVKNINLLYNEDRNCAYSVRNEKRPRSSQVYHEVKYLLDYGVNGNHLNLYFQDPQELARQEANLSQFKTFLREIYSVLSAKDLENFLTSHRNFLKVDESRMTIELKKFMNMCRPFKEAWRFWVEEADFEEMMGPDRDNYRITI